MRIAEGCPDSADTRWKVTQVPAINLLVRPGYSRKKRLGAQGGQVYVTKALEVEKAGRVMAVGYLQIVFAAVWGLLLFSEIPDLWTGLGATVIIGSTFLMGRLHPVAAPRGR